MKELPVWLIVLTGGFVILLLVSVLGPFIGEGPPEYAPTRAEPEDVGEDLVTDRLVTLEARDENRWVFFDFSTGSAVEHPGPLGWDLAVRRFQVVTNGGPSFEGSGGAIDLGETPFEEVARAPENGYLDTQGSLSGQVANPALEDWYRYSFTSHTLMPHPRSYAIRTADGRYARVRILGYYCPGATPGCLTFRYGYQGDGSRRLAVER